MHTNVSAAFNGTASFNYAENVRRKLRAGILRSINPTRGTAQHNRCNKRIPSVPQIREKRSRRHAMDRHLVPCNMIQNISSVAGEHLVAFCVGPSWQPSRTQDLLFICEALLFHAHCRIAFFLESICAFLLASPASRRLRIVGTGASSK